MADNVANNLANVNTGGFKRTLLQITSAPSLDIYRIQTDPGRVPGARLSGVPVAQPVGALGTGAWVYDTPTQFEQGAIQQTGNALDVALGSENAFFTVQTPQGVKYTRDGQFYRDPNNNLVTSDGYQVLGQGGPIALPNGNVAIAADGTITANGARIDQLRVTSFNNLVALRAQGDSLLQDTGNAGPQATANPVMQQGALEMGNANVVRSMVDMILAERTFDANEKSIKAEDDATARAISTVGLTQPG